MTSVLIIDDELEVQTLLSLMLNGEGFFVRKAGSGSEAIAAYREQPADVVVTDLRMPEMDGIQVIYELKEIDPHVAVIVLTGYAELESAVDLMREAGVYNYLSKPLDTPEVLFGAINGALEKRRLSLENQQLLADLQRANEELERQVADRTGALMVSNRQLSQELRRRKQSERALEKERADLQRRVKERTHKLARINRQLNMEVMERRRGESALNGDSGDPLKLDDGLRVATRHIFQDISEQQQAQELIRRSKTMLQAVFDGIQDPLIMVDRKMVVRMINRAAKTYYHIDDYRQIIGNRCPDVFAGDDHCETCRIPQLVASGQSTTFERPGLFGENRLERVAVYPLCQSAGGLDGAIIQISDITETKNLERQLFHSEKLASLGLLASGVAHEINNPNGFITFNLPILRNYISAVMTHVTSGDQLRDDKCWFGMSFDAFYADLFQLIDNMEHGAQRISKIVASMNTLARPKTVDGSLRKCRLDQVLEQVETLCSGELKRVGQKLTMDYPADLPELMLDAGSLEQVLINLLMNAAQAADKTGAWIRLTVERPEADILVIVVQDNGCGMDETVRQKIFDPFFTTKAPGSGIGLGMAICHNLVVSMGGTIQAESVVGLGSRFRITLPDLFYHGAGKTDSTGQARIEDQEPLYRSA
ncbi:MAG: response regulator [Desulfobacteraceae bacterium]|jgi:PAS domain S-box-containing protein